MTPDSRSSVQSLLGSVIDSSPSGLLLVDGEGTIVLVNREVERLFGYPREELLGRSVDLLLPERFRRGHAGFRAAFVRDPQARAMGAGRELFGLHKSGVEVPIEIGLNPMETEEGLFVLSSIVDISARKRAEEERRGLEEQLRHAQKLEAIGTLAGGIAHDFNNILGVVFGYAELLKTEVTGEEAQADIRELLTAAERGRQLVRQILAFSRRQPIHRKPIALGESVAEAVKLLRPMLPPTVELRFLVMPETHRVLGDVTGVHQVVMNLGTNALQAMPDGGVLEIVVEPFYVRDSVARARPDLREGGYIRLLVRDTGLGMEESVRQRALEPFYTTKPAGSGTGLGLAIVRGIMLDHEGTVELASAPGEGTTVSCLFPTLPAGEEVVPEGAPPTPRGAGERILFVDDERALGQIAERNLRALGYRPTILTDAAEALTRLRQSPDAFDLLVTDLTMPKMGGLDLSRAVHALRPDLPILLATGFVEDIPAEDLAAVGIVTTARKPLSQRELGEAIHLLLRGRAR